MESKSIHPSTSAYIYFFFHSTDYTTDVRSETILFFLNIIHLLYLLTYLLSYVLFDLFFSSSSVRLSSALGGFICLVLLKCYY